MTALAAPAPGAVAQVVRFAAYLREHGFRVGVAEQQAFLTVARALPLDRWRQVQAAWRAIACQDPRDWRRWSEVFEGFWFPQKVKGTVRSSGFQRRSADLRQTVQALQDELGAAAGRPAPSGTNIDTALAPPQDQADTGEAPVSRAQGGASRTEALHDRALSMWLPQDLAQLQALAERIVRRLRERLTRRWADHPLGQRLDVRMTLRRSLRTGGWPLDPAWRRPRTERPRLFILVDVSRSMETHAQLFLRVARAFVSAAQARVFVFHTRLTEVTPLLRRDSTAVQEKVNAVTAGFGGGTRIATSLSDFHQTHARAQLGRNARVWVLSDGFDADEPHRLADELGHVRRHGAQITWFHPSPQVPASAAISAARDRISRFVRLNSLNDLSLAAAQLR